MMQHNRESDGWRTFRQQLPKIGQMIQWTTPDLKESVYRERFTHPENFAPDLIWKEASENDD